MQKLTEQQIKELQDKYQGKIVELSWVSYQGRNLGSVRGECYFIGYNPYLPKFGLQVTINRTPYTNVDLKNLKLYEEA